MTGCGSDTLTLGILGGGGGTDGGIAGCGSLGGMGATLGISLVLAGLKISCLDAIGAAFVAAWLEPVDLAKLLP